jgi:hypothetical protein
VVDREKGERLNMSEIDDVLSKYTDYDSENVWDVYKNNFLRRSPESRYAEPQAFDKFCDDKMSTPTRETADLLARQRSLVEMHTMLRKLGR